MRPPWWTLVSSVAAPVLLIGGWTLAQAVQPRGYDAVHDTISALARHDGPHRWIMTAGLAGLGLAHVVSALGLRALPWWSRGLLALAGVATVGVAVFAEPYSGSSRAHVTAATIAFVALVLWPASASSRDGTVAPLRPRVAVGVSLLSAGLLIWFAVGGPAGVSERVLAAEQALWPLVVVVALRRRPARMAS